MTEQMYAMLIQSPSTPPRYFDHANAATSANVIHNNTCLLLQKIELNYLAKAFASSSKSSQLPDKFAFDCLIPPFEANGRELMVC